MIEQVIDLLAANADEVALTPKREDVFLEETLDLRSRAQPYFRDIDFEPFFRRGLVRGGLRWRRLEGRLALLDAPDRLARNVPGLLDLQHVGAADRRPNLRAIAITRHGDVDVRAFGHHADVHAVLLGIGQHVTLGAAGQGGDHSVGQGLAALTAHLFGHQKSIGLTGG